MTIILSIPPKLPISTLEQALEKTHFFAKIILVYKDWIKIKPLKGQCKESLEFFVRGFIAGFTA